MNHARHDSERNTGLEPLVFRVADHMRLEGCVAAITQDAMSVSLVSAHEAILDHYGRLLVQRLRDEAPDLTLEVYCPASVEALLGRFNEALKDQSVDDAMHGPVQDAPPRIWILHDASALPDHEIELLARLVEHFPGANIRVILLLTAASNKHQLLSSFGRRILHWDIEPPTAEQAQALLSQARSEGREGEVRALLQGVKFSQPGTANPSDPIVAATNSDDTDIEHAAVPETASWTQQAGKSKTLWWLIGGSAALLVASTIATSFLHPGAWTLAIDTIVAKFTETKASAGVAASAVPAVPAASAALPAASAPGDVPSAAAAPASSASDTAASSGSNAPALAPASAPAPANSTQPQSRAALEEVIAPSPQTVVAQNWVRQLSSAAYFVQHVTRPSIQEASQWSKRHDELQMLHVVPMFLSNASAIEYAVVSGPFASRAEAQRYAASD
ncbi:MAG: hypothetical protein ACR2I0_12575, partial [Rhodoferax sp.]